MLNDDDNKNYFETNYFLKLLRFFNLLEPDRNILSISKIATWFFIGVVVFVLFVTPDNIEIILGSVSGLIATMMNYSYRRWIQTSNLENGIKPRRFDDNDVEDVSNEVPTVLEVTKTYTNQVDSPEG